MRQMPLREITWFTDKVTTWFDFLMLITTLIISFVIVIPLQYHITITEKSNLITFMDYFVIWDRIPSESCETHF